jgi:hypothetical protein
MEDILSEVICTAFQAIDRQLGEQKTLPYVKGGVGEGGGYYRMTVSFVQAHIAIEVDQRPNFSANFSCLQRFREIVNPDTNSCGPHCAINLGSQGSTEQDVTLDRNRME